MKKQIADFLGELAEEMGWSPEPGEPRITLPTSMPARPAAPADPVQSTTTTTGSVPPATPRETSSPASAGQAPSPFEAQTHRTDLIETQVKQLRRTVEHLASEITNLRTEMARLRHMPAPPDSAAADRKTADTEAAPPTMSLLERFPREEATDNAEPRDTAVGAAETPSPSALGMFNVEHRDRTEPSRLDLFR